MKKLKEKVAVFSLLASCFMFNVSFVFAQQPKTTITVFQNVNRNFTFTALANKIGTIANSVIPFLIGLAIALMVFGIFKYVTSAGDTEKVAEGRKTILYGLVAIFIIFSFWGLVLVIHKSIFG